MKLQTAPTAPTSTRILRKPGVKEMTGLSGTTLWRMVRAGTFPKPLVLSANCVGWRESDVVAWLADLKTRA